MNKRLIFIGGGSFMVLLALFAVLSTSQDDSKLSTSIENSFLSLQQTTILKDDLVSGLVSQGENTNGLEAVNPNQKTNNTRLSQAITFVSNSIADSTAPRMQAIITTDKHIYRANDTLFVEVLLIDTIRNGPITFPNNSKNVNDTFVTVQVGITTIMGQEVYSTEFNITNTTGPAGSVVFKLPTFIVQGDYAIRAGGYKFSPATKIVTVRATSSQYDDQYFSEDDQIYYNISIQLLDYNPPTMNSTLWGKISVSSPQGADFPENVQLFTTYGNTSDMASAQVYDLTSDGTCYFAVDTDSELFQTGNYLTLYAYTSMNDLGYFYSDDVVVSFGELPPNKNIDDNNGEDEDLLDPRAIKVYFQHESLSDLVFNATQKVYLYSYINYEDDNLTSEFFQFGKGQIRAYNQAFMNLPPINITEVKQSVNGFGSFVFTPKELLTYFLEIQVFSLIEAQEENDLNMNKDNITMDGHHIFTNGTVRIPLIVEGYQTRRQRFNQMIDQQNHPENYEPTFNMDIIDDLSFDFQDFETGFTYTCFLPDQDGNLPQDVSISTVTFNAAQVVSKFVQYTATAIYQLDEANYMLLGLTQDNGDQNVEILSKLFPGSGKVTANIFGTYGPDWLKSKCVQNNTNNQSTPANITRVQQGAEVSVSVLNTAKVLAFTRTVANNEDLNVQFSTNNFLDPNDYYLLTIRQRERIIYNDTFKLPKGVSTKTIKANQFNLILGGIMTLNLYKITEEYFLFQNTTNTTICEQSMIEQLISDGTLTIKSNGEVTYNEQDITYYQDDLSQSILTQANISANSTIQLPYTPINDKNCVILDIDQVVSFLEQRASINFFKRPSTNVSVEITTNKNNYMQGEQVNATVTVRNKATGAIITDPGFVYVSATEDAELFETMTADLPTQLYLLNDIDEDMVRFLNPAKSLGQYFGNNGSSSNDSTFEFIMVANQLRYYAFEMEYYQYMSRNLSFGVGHDLVLNDIIGQNQLYGLNFMRDFLPENQELLYRYMEIAQYYEKGYETTYGPFEPYRRSYAPADFMPQQSGLMTGQNWTHNTSIQDDTYPNYNRGAYLDWTETLFWGSGIKVQAGKANITFKTSDLSTNYRIHANYYGATQGVATSFKRFTVGKAFKFTFEMPKRMSVEDSYNATLFFENFSPNNLTIKPFPLSVDQSLQIKAANGTDLTLLSFFAPANKNTSFTVVVTPLKASKSARIVLSASATDLFNGKYEEIDEETSKVVNLALPRKSIFAGIISTNTSDSASTITIPVRFPDNSTFATTNCSIYVISSMFGQLLYTMDLLDSKEPETSDDCVSRIDLYSQTVDRIRGLADLSNQNLQILGILQDLQYRQFQLIKKLKNFLINSGTAQNPNYQGFDQFPGDGTPVTSKNGSIAVTALNVFINKINMGMGQFEGVNKTNDQHLKFLLGRKKAYNNYSHSPDHVNHH